PSLGNVRHHGPGTNANGTIGTGVIVSKGGPGNLATGTGSNAGTTGPSGAAGSGTKTTTVNVSRPVIGGPVNLNTSVHKSGHGGGVVIGGPPIGPLNPVLNNQNVSVRHTPGHPLGPNNWGANIHNTPNWGWNNANWN